MKTLKLDFINAKSYIIGLRVDMWAKRKSAEDEEVDGDTMPTKKKKILQRYRDLYH